MFDLRKHFSIIDISWGQDTYVAKLDIYANNTECFGVDLLCDLVMADVFHTSAQSAPSCE